MSTLLEQASLIMIPSGYKEDVVYSVIPTNGNGDLSFTRASNGTRINSAGLVEVTPWNLVQNSENFTSNWNPNSNTITANSTTAPNGTITADTFTLTASADSSVYQAVNGVSNNYTSFVYAKYVSGGQYLYFFSPLNSQGAKVWFDIQNGTVSNQIGDFVGTIENVGNGWFKCAVYNSTAVVSDYIQFGISSTNSSRTLSTNSVSFFWGAQVNIGTIKPYFPTTDRLNVPRLTYQNGGGGCPSLLLEKQSTNLTLYSEQFSNAYWIKNQITLSANATTSPDGTTNATSIIPSTANSALHRIFENSSNSIATAAYSIFVKPNGYYRVALRESGTTGAAIGFDLLNETIITTFSTGGCTASGGKIENMGNGFYRISGIFSFASAAGQSLGLYVVSPSWTSGDPESVSWAGNGTDGIFIYGAQVEASSYPTSYIPTTSSSATRVADACFKTGISSLIGQTEGTLFWEGIIDQIPTDQTIFGVEKQASNFVIRFGGNGSQIYAQSYNGVTSLFFETISITLGQKYKLAFGYKAGSYAFYKDGVLVANGTNASTMPTCDKVQTNQLWFTSGGLGLYKTNQAILFPTRLSNSDLIALTTL